MNFKFRKSKKILPGVKLNVTNKGVSANIGGKHANVGIGKRGVHGNVSAGGVSGRQKLGGCGSLIAILATAAIIIICAFAGFAQSRPKLTNQIKVTTPATEEEQQQIAPPVASESPWTYLGYTFSPRSDVYYRELRERYGRSEAWTKWIPKKPLAGTGRMKVLRQVKYYLQFTTVDCEGKRITLESTRFYDKNNRLLNVPYSFAFTKFAEPILPETFAELIWDEFCS